MADKSAASARCFPNALHKACPIGITKVLTDNGKAFTDRLFASQARHPSGNHEFDVLRKALGIAQRLTKPGTPQAIGRVERFNGRIADVLKTHHFTDGQEMRQTLKRYVHLHNHQLPHRRCIRERLLRRCKVGIMKPRVISWKTQQDPLSGI